MTASTSCLEAPDSELHLVIVTELVAAFVRLVVPNTQLQHLDQVIASNIDVLRMLRANSCSFWATADKKCL